MSVAGSTTLDAAALAQATAVVAGNTPDQASTATSNPANDVAAGTGSDSITTPSMEAEGHSKLAESTPPSSNTEGANTPQSIDSGVATHAKVAQDGRVNIHINHPHRRLSSLLGPAFHRRISSHGSDQIPASSSIPQALPGAKQTEPPPPMNIVIQIVGSRGDVQPFVALGQALKKYGHRVRLATHATFQTFVEENGLEFFNIGGDPAELMAFMVKNPGLMPGFETLRSGDVGKRRKGIYEMLKGCWRSCIEPGDGSGVPVNDDQLEDSNSVVSAAVPAIVDEARPFIADVIIANPPSFAHIHCAEKLGIPLHIMFTMPWSPTQAFPHPLANIVSSNADTSMSNFVSYALVEMLTWQGLGDMINRFRERTLKLEPVSIMWAPGMLSRLRIPYTYCWSPALIPKPRDWGSHINISGFYFLALASSYTPDPELVAFLEAGPPPVYIGFGSIVVDDPTGLTKLIFDAVKKAGVRALVSKGWGGLGTEELGKPDNIYMLGNVPHDWLFKYVSAVVHHGGAGTTAAGVALGKPTVVVPFFGDQPFWGSMIARAGAGPPPIPYKELTADNLAEALVYAQQPSTQAKAAELGARISKEVGSETGAESFHRQLDVKNLRCSLAPSRVAVWRVKRTKVRLSALAAAVLGREGIIDSHDLKLYRSVEYESEDGPWDPITGGASALIGSIGSLVFGVADFPVEVLKALTTKPPERGAEHPSRSNTFKTLSRSSTESSLASPKLRPSTRPTLESPISTPKKELSSPLGVVTSVDATEGVAIPSEESTTQTPVLSPAPEEPEHHHHRVSFHLGHHPKHNHPVAADASVPSHLFSHPDCPACQAARHAALEAGQGVGRIVEAGLKSPMDFTLAMARGFHNAPKLYGDKTVRQPETVTGFGSGLKAAGKGFGQGLYDGISGLVTQPFEGAKEEGALGLVKGIGRGIGGLILKPQAAFWGIPGYTFRGIYKEIQRHFGSSTENYIIAARTAQGYEDLMNSSPEEHGEIIQKWKLMQEDIRKARLTFAEETRETVNELKVKRQQTLDLNKQHRQERKKEGGHGNDTPEKPGHLHRHFSFPRLHHAHTHPGAPKEDAKPMDYEEAIQTSVRSTSQGDPEQDELIERAIRASVEELVSAQQAQVEYQDALQRAIQASIAETRKADAEKKEKKEKDNLVDQEAAYGDEERLKEALRQSLEEYHLGPRTDDSKAHHMLEENVPVVNQTGEEAGKTVELDKEGEEELSKATEDKLKV
ncbi:MAG: L-arabinitol 4-dehydrogenase [Watsoniomyces obsoletus]|nr:MAG: L-arabinitol 4-dehydrogenase [Watsoniomyces obsoletus]